VIKSIFSRLICAANQGEPVALGIVTGVKGSSPQKIGAKAIFHADGRIEGTLGGGCLEAEVQDRARRALVSQKPSQFELVLDHDFGWDDGLICGGKVYGVILPNVLQYRSIWDKLARRDQDLVWGVQPDFSVHWADDPGEWLYQERVTPPCALWIAGAGHIAQAVAPLALNLDFDVRVIDDRPALANHQFFPEPVTFGVGSWEKILSEPMPAVPAFGLIVTRGHRHDALVLRQWVHRPFVFLGMIGSRRKARLIFSQFLEEKIAGEKALSRVACPVGIDIAAHTVPEIAVSILAQYIQKRAEYLALNSPSPALNPAPIEIAPGS
jgi:xanthine dehydrogenase accessory factor